MKFLRFSAVIFVIFIKRLYTYNYIRILKFYFKFIFRSKLINFKVLTKYNINLISFIFKQLIRNESNLHIKYNPIKFIIKVHLKNVIILINLKCIINETSRNGLIKSMLINFAKKAH